MDLDEFSDDGLDDLPDNALQELENNAIQLTQAQAHPKAQQKPPTQQNQASQPEYIWIEDDDLDTTEVTDDVGVPIGRPVVDTTPQKYKKPTQPQPQQQLQDSRRSVPPVPNPRWNPVVDPSKRGPSGLASRPGPPSVGAPNVSSQRFQSQAPNLARAQPSQIARSAIPQNRFPTSQLSQNKPSDPLSALQQRILTLETELNNARGEITIVRSLSAKAQQQHDAEIVRLKKANADQLAKQERIAEAAVAAQRTASTELQFLQLDMKEVSGRARRKDTAGGPSVGATTPKKTTKSWRPADGFDDLDIVTSPNKGQGRSKTAGSVAVHVGERTPSKGKRKRPAVDSPVMALETHVGDVFMDDAVPKAAPTQPENVVVAEPPQPFEFLPLVLDHACFPQQPLTFEILSRLSFPSEPDTSISAIIFQTLPAMGKPDYPIQILVDFATHMTILWMRCSDEKFWEPVKYLVSLISFTLNLQATEVAPLLIGSLVPIALLSIQKVTENRFRLVDGEPNTNQEHSDLEEHIDSTEILQLLHTTALTCVTAFEETNLGFKPKIVQFWSHLSVEFVYLVSGPKQNLGDVLGMLDLLTTSALPDSIGPLYGDYEPLDAARRTIDRVSAYLVEVPRVADTLALKRTVRLAALRTLISFARYPFGAIQLAANNIALPRLVTCLSASLDALYDQPIPQNILPAVADDGNSTEAESPYSELCRIVSQCVTLIHTLVTSPHTTNVADISQKLSVYQGGSQRYLLALGRLTFAEEDLVMEAGIDGDTVEAAHELLEMIVTPDEGEVVSEAFGA